MSHPKNKRLPAGVIQRESLLTCPGIVGPVITGELRRCMARGRSTVIGFGGSCSVGHRPGFTGFGSRRFSKVRCGFTSRASAASLLASTSSTVRQRFENRNTLTRRGPGSISIRPRWSSSFSDDRDVLPSDVMIEPEVVVAHARAAAVTDRPLDRTEHPPRAAGAASDRPVSLCDLSSSPPSIVRKVGTFHQSRRSSTQCQHHRASDGDHHREEDQHFKVRHGPHRRYLKFRSDF